jgi:hypothetical protein
MALWICQGCVAAYSVDAPRCPQCGSTDYINDFEEGADMAKITVHGGPSNASAEPDPAEAQPAPAEVSAPEPVEVPEPAPAAPVVSAAPAPRGTDSELTKAPAVGAADGAAQAATGPSGK